VEAIHFPSVEPINPKINAGDFIRYYFSVKVVELDAEFRRLSDYKLNINDSEEDYLVLHQVQKHIEGPVDGEKNLEWKFLKYQDFGKDSSFLIKKSNVTQQFCKTYGAHSGE
jgi:hypothetical protein